MGLPFWLEKISWYHIVSTFVIIGWVSLWGIISFWLKKNKGKFLYLLWMVVFLALPFLPFTKALNSFALIQHILETVRMLSVSRVDPGGGGSVELPREAAGTGEFSPTTGREGELEAPGDDPVFNLSLNRVATRISLEIIVYRIVGAVWLVGALFFLARLVAGFISLHRIITNAREPGDHYSREILRELKEAMGIKKCVRLLVSNRVERPFCAGIFHPVIIVPASLSNNKDDRKIRQLLIHELAHIRQKDFLLTFIQRITEILFFYHPLMWLAGRMVEYYRELSCDDWVLFLDGNTSDYARSLLDFVKTADSPAIPAVNSVFGNFYNVKRRIHYILEHKGSKTMNKPKVSVTKFLPVLFIILIGVFGTGILIGEDVKEPVGGQAISTHDVSFERLTVAMNFLKGGDYKTAISLFNEAKHLDMASGDYDYAVVAQAGLAFMENIGAPVTTNKMFTYGAACEVLESGGGDKIIYTGQPGIGGASGGKEMRRFDMSPLWDISRMGEFIFPDKYPGEEWSLESKGFGEASLDTNAKVISIKETVETPAGTFQNCRHLSFSTTLSAEAEKEEINTISLNRWLMEDSLDVWYSPGTGLVKIVKKNDLHDVELLLREFSVEPGDPSCFPLRPGNRWIYGYKGAEKAGIRSENGFEVHYADGRDKYYLSHYQFGYKLSLENEETVETGNPLAGVPLYEADHKKQNLSTGIKPDYHVAHERITQYMETAFITVKSGKTAGIRVDENGAGVEILLVTAQVAGEWTAFRFRALDSSSKVIADWEVSNVMIGTVMRSVANSDIHPEYLIKVQVKPEKSGDDELRIKVDALFAISPTVDEMKMYKENLPGDKGKAARAIADMSKMTEPVHTFCWASGQMPEDPEKLIVKYLVDVFSPSGEFYRTEFYDEGFLVYSCGADGIYETGDDEVIIKFPLENKGKSGNRVEFVRSGSVDDWIDFK